MTFQLKDIVPWGRSFEEYVAMFALSEEDLRGSILSCADGPSSFNCESCRRGVTVVSIDPLYDYGTDQIKKRIDETFEEVMTQTGKNMEEFVWKHISSVEELGRVRMEAMRTFLSDYDSGKSEGRYLPSSLPSLSFPDNRFTLALCSHFLFLYSNMLDLQFHISAIREMCRVAREARIFPLLQLGAKPSPHVPGVVEHFGNAGYKVDIVTVIYEFQRGGNKMLRIRKA
ncbi:MAG: SAM-dependent methyltransferase [bacterium]